jgi:hypothetical protein
LKYLNENDDGREKKLEEREKEDIGDLKDFHNPIFISC